MMCLRIYPSEPAYSYVLITEQFFLAPYGTPVDMPKGSIGYGCYAYSVKKICGVMMTVRIGVREGVCVCEISFPG